MKKAILIFLSLFIIMDLNAQQTLVLQPGPDEGTDAQIWTIHPDNNYGWSLKFSCMGWTFYGEPGIQRALIDFDLTAIPEYSTILDARMDLFFVCLEPNYFGHSGNNEAYLQLITTPWGENTVTWNTQPPTTTLDQVYLPQSTDPYMDYTDIDVTAPVRRLFEEPESYFGIMLRLVDENPYNCLLFASSDYMDTIEMRPKLVVTYLDCQAPAAGFTYMDDQLNVYFQDTSSMAQEYFWDFGDGYFSSLQNPWHAYQYPGEYMVCLNVSNDCYSDSACTLIEVCLHPISGFDYDIDYLTVYFTNNSSEADGYLWDFGDGYFSNLPDPVHIYDVTGNYQVCLITWNECSSDTLCELIDLSTAALMEDSQVGLSCFYPNPVTVHLNIKPGIGDLLNFELFDLQGRTVISRRMDFVQNTTRTIDVGFLPDGIYFARLTGNNYSKSQKIIILK